MKKLSFVLLSTLLIGAFGAIAFLSSATIRAKAQATDIRYCHYNNGASEWTVSGTGDFVYDGDCDPEDQECEALWCSEHQPSETPTPTPTPTGEPTATPTPTPTETTNTTTNTGGPGDGRSDGRSSCPECTAAPTGQVLGATTDYAATGVASEMLMNALGAMGGLSAASGLAMIAKRKQNK